MKVLLQLCNNCCRFDSVSRTIKFWVHICSPCLNDRKRFKNYNIFLKHFERCNSSIIMQNLKTDDTRKQSALNFPKCGYQGVRNFRFFGKFGALCFLVISVLRFAFLPYYRRIATLIISAGSELSRKILCADMHRA